MNPNISNKINISHRIFEKKCVYKVKQDVDGNITLFKAR